MSTDILEEDFDIDVIEDEYDEPVTEEVVSKSEPGSAGNGATTQVPFVHLHTHSHYSLLDGAARIDSLISRAKEFGMTSLALTDHGNLFGALEFYQKARDKGIKPIIGYEAYIAPGSRFDKSLEAGGSRKDTSYHLTLLAINRTGYQNLLKLGSAAFTEGFYYKPRIDRQLLEEHNEGLICLSGCASSEFARMILDGESDNFERAKNIAKWYKELFGDRYYIELQDHGLELQKIVLEHSVPIAEEFGIQTVATNDVHYIDLTDAPAQDLLLCLNTGKFRSDVKRMRMDSDKFYFRSGEDMLRALPNQRDAVLRSQEIADRCDCDLELGKRYFPVFTPPEGYTSDEYLRHLCLEGLKKRYANNPKRYKNGEFSEEVMNRLDRELSVIQKLGFPNYFLIVWDFVRVAEERGIHRTARGSGVGALVCFALNMSHVCPLDFDLLFERFLDENRIEAPDIDIDFDQLRRGEILDYVKEKYGESNVAQIGTFGTMAAKASIKAVGRALGIPIGAVNDITKLVPEAPKMTLKKAFDQSAELCTIYEENGEVKELIDFAKAVEGLASNAGTHACAVVIADKPITEYVPLQRIKDKEDIVTQWAMGDVEKAGLLKMDFLGLRNLSILANAIEIIKETHGGEVIDPYSFPLDDKPTFELLCRGETKGVFQLEGGGIRELLQRMKPDNFRDIIATLALYRPGPLEGGMVDQYVDVKHKRRQAEYLHPVMKDVLEETNGVMVYQEQIMRILNRLGKIPLASSYSCIKAISKKKEDLINKFHADFVKGAAENGLTETQAAELFELIKKFAGYGFNKSHSTAYALVAYMTAYLKAHYPVEFMAALLCGDISGRNFTKKDATVEHIEDCARMGIEVVPPDVNKSFREYKVRDGKIIFGMSAIKGCSESAADAISAEREKNGPFHDIFDLCQRIDPTQCTKSTLETLIKAGALDSFGCKRSQLTQVLERAFKSGQTAASDRKTGQKSLFGSFGEEEDTAAISSAATSIVPGLPEIEEWNDKEKSTYEKEVLGFYLTCNPMGQYEQMFEMFRSHTNYEGVRLKDKAEVTLCGTIGDIKISSTKNPKPGKPSQFAM
ncbi:MAG: DNA polymerase III subunit alpha, partial [Thermoguttaceae bacterium]